MREEDQSWIYTVYTCRARNQYGVADVDIQLSRASKECSIADRRKFKEL